ncbi:hypothetical protein [Agromyces sp. NPDC058126]|uniref:hypothetical protein n=1 Tax=Agromyces sp. NPDC058126 TaxID=3346350 RepID=UPI0036D78C9F
MADLTIEQSALIELTGDLERAAELIEHRRAVADCDGAAFGSALVESAVAETVSLLEVRRAVVERTLLDLAAHPARVLDDFADLDAAIAGGV